MTTSIPKWFWPNKNRISPTFWGNAVSPQIKPKRAQDNGHSFLFTQKRTTLQRNNHISYLKGIWGESSSSNKATLQVDMGLFSQKGNQIGSLPHVKFPASEGPQMPKVQLSGGQFLLDFLSPSGSRGHFSCGQCTRWVQRLRCELWSFKKMFEAQEQLEI